jgi:type II secretory pathway predicted ATPase ExeA/septal ring-binding cell division protein DamX
MYLSHFGLNEPPFRITPHTEFFFSGANRGATLEALLYAITHDEGIVKVAGEVGSGKTMLCRVLVERLPKNVETIYLANPSLSRDEILHVIAADLQVESRGERVTILLRALQEKLIKLYAAGRRVVVLIDEAHAMPLETLEEIRLLSNLESNRHKLLQLVLFGQPELDEHLALPNMRQLKERITHSFKLEPLVRSDIDSYVDFRMRAAGYRGPKLFGPPAMKLIARASEGLTRRINILSDKALLAAFVDGAHEITAKHARAAVRDAEFATGRRLPAKWWLVGAGLAVGLLFGAALHYYDRLSAGFGRPASSSAAPAGPSVTDVRPTGGVKEAEPSPLAGASGGPVSQATAAPSPAMQTPTTVEAAGQPSPAPSAGAAPSPSPTPTPAPAPSPAPSAGAAPSPAPSTSSPALVAVAPSASTSGTKTSGTKTSGTNTVKPAVPAGPVPPTSGRLIQDRFAATQQWLRTAPAGHYAIQLLTVSANEVGVMERFLRQASELVDVNEMRVYSVKLGGQQHYAATYGLYPSLEETITAMGDLPSSFKARAPYHRSVTLMRRQNQE